MRDVTVIYYSSNREKPEFEDMILKNLMKTINGLPLITVSHTPLSYGQNICVGDVGLSDYNIYRQMQIGTLAARTKYVCTAEADCLYPPTGYFDFQPPDDWTAGHYTNMYILWKGSHIFKQKAFSLCALYAEREFLLDRFPRALDRVQWRPDFKPKHPLFHKWHDWTPFRGDIPVINIKTGDGMRMKSGVGTEGPPQTELPYWGSAVGMEETLWKI